MTEDNFDFGNSEPLSSASGLSAGAREFIKHYIPADDDSGCIAVFHSVEEFKPHKSAVASDKEGKAVEIFEPVVFIRINIRGNDKLEIDRPCRDEDKRRFPYAWQEFLRGTEEIQRGTPLLKLPGIDASTIRAYNARNVWTIEDLALVDDQNLQNLGTNAREFRRAAQAFTNAKPATADDGLREQVNALSAQLAKAMALIEMQNEALQKPKPGRKPGSKNKPKDESAAA